MNELCHTLSKTGTVDCAPNSWHAFSDSYSEFADLRMTNSRLSDIIDGPTTTLISIIDANAQIVHGKLMVGHGFAETQIKQV